MSQLEWMILICIILGGVFVLGTGKNSQWWRQ